MSQSLLEYHSLEHHSKDPVPAFFSKIAKRSSSPREQLLNAIASLAFLGVLCWIDIASGPKVHLGLLFLVPVLVAAWFGGRWPGYVLGIAASLVWLFIGRPKSDGNDHFVNGLNLLIRVGFYIIVVELLVQLRGIGHRLEDAVLQRTADLRREIGERLRAEDSLRKLAGQLSAAEDVERRRIAYDIHDALSQMLGLAKMNLETVIAETPIDTRQFDRLCDVVKMVNELIRQTREMTFDLHPSMLDHFGLVPTLQRFAEDYNKRTLAEVSVTESGTRLVLPSSLASYLFRAIKEVISNAVRHGNAREIIVSVHWENGRLRTVVDDDGCGFDPVKALTPQARRGLGLAGIDERLTSLGGQLRLESSAGGGTRAMLEVPVSGEPDPAGSPRISSTPAAETLVSA